MVSFAGSYFCSGVALLFVCITTYKQSPPSLHGQHYRAVWYEYNHSYTTVPSSSIQCKFQNTRVKPWNECNVVKCNVLDIGCPASQTPVCAHIIRRLNFCGWRISIIFAVFSFADAWVTSIILLIIIHFTTAFCICSAQWPLHVSSSRLCHGEKASFRSRAHRTDWPKVMNEWAFLNSLHQDNWSINW